MDIKENIKEFKFFNSFFVQLRNSILYFEKYPDLLNNKLSKTLLFGVIMLNISLIVGGIVPMLLNYNKVGGFDNFINNNIPEFQVENNKLLISEYQIKTLNNNIVIIFDPLDEKKITNSDLKASGLDEKGIIIKLTPSYLLSQNILGIGTAINLDIYLDVLQIKNRDDLLILKQPFLLATFFSFIFAMNLYLIIALFMTLMACIWVNFFSIFYNIKLPLKELIKFTIYINIAPLSIQVIFSIINLIISPVKIIMPSLVYFGVVVSYAHFVLKHFQQEKLYAMPVVDIKI